MEFKSDIYGKKTHLKFEEKKPDFKAEFVPTKNEEMFFEVNLNRGVLKKTSNFYHENEDIISDSGNMKNYLNSHESNL